MKIRELLEAMTAPVEKTLPPLQHPWDYSELRRAEKKSSTKDSGLYSRGKDIPDNPHEYQVTTHYPTDLKVDGKYWWVKACAEHSDNPYLPQYYNIHLQPDSKGLIRTIYTMEKLWSLDSLLEYRIEAEYGNKYMPRGELIKVEEEQGDYLQQELVVMAQKMFKDPDIYSFHEFPMQFWEKEIITPIRNAIYGTIEPNWDKKLLEAIKIIREVLNKNKLFSLDFHKGNCLLRKTPYGLQFVITDPIRDSELSIINPPQSLLK